jgi:hypothetical protein
MVNKTTFAKCAIIQYIMMLGDFVFRLSFAAFLLLELKDIHDNKRDTRISLFLLALRFAITVGIAF